MGCWSGLLYRHPVTRDVFKQTFLEEFTSSSMLMAGSILGLKIGSVSSPFWASKTIVACPLPASCLGRWRIFTCTGYRQGIIEHTARWLLTEPTPIPIGAISDYWNVVGSKIFRPGAHIPITGR